MSQMVNLCKANKLCDMLKMCDGAIGEYKWKCSLQINVDSYSFEQSLISKQ